MVLVDDLLSAGDLENYVTVQNRKTSSEIRRRYPHQVSSKLTRQLSLNQVHMVWETADDLCDPGDLDVQDGSLKLKSHLTYQEGLPYHI